MAWAAVAGLGLLSGCHTSDPCRPSLMSRMGCCKGRCTPTCTQGTTTIAAPVVSMPMMGGGIPFTGESSFGLADPGSCCNGGGGVGFGGFDGGGGPILPPSAVPGESLYTSPMLSAPVHGNGYPHGPALGGGQLPPGMTFGAPIYLPPGAPLPQGAVPMTPGMPYGNGNGNGNGNGHGAASNNAAAPPPQFAPPPPPPTLPSPSPSPSPAPSSEPPGVIQIPNNGRDYATPMPAPPTSRRKS
jgi:hypothetical protein